MIIKSQRTLFKPPFLEPLCTNTTKSIHNVTNFFKKILCIEYSLLDYVLVIETPFSL